MPAQKKYLPYLMWLFPLLFFAFQFILRLWPGLMMKSLLEQFSIDASHFGMLAACYYFGYAGMQIPVAILLDRFGARKIVFSFALLCGVATLFFTYTNNFYLAIFSRFLVGAGSAVGFLGVSKIVSEWFPINQYARMIGLSFSFGLIGAIYGGKPISLLIEHHSATHVSFMLAIISIVLGLATYLTLQSPQKTEEGTSLKPIHFHQFKSILNSPSIWWLGLANLLMVGSLEGFADVWGVPYLMKSFGLSKTNAAGLISFIFFGMLFGGPLLAYLSKKLGNYTVIAIAGIGMALAFSTLLLTKFDAMWFLAMLFFSVGILCCYQVIVFAAGSSLVERTNLGITIAFLNCINMLGGSFFHTIIGKIMDIYWTGLVDQGGIRIYTLSTFNAALSVIPISAMIGTLIILFLDIKIRRKRRFQHEGSGNSFYRQNDTTTMNVHR